MKPLFAILTLSLGLMAMAAGSAQPPPFADRGTEHKGLLIAKDRRVSAQEAARAAQARYGGKVLSVKMKQPPGERPYYRVKLLSNGHVRVVRIDAGR